MHLVEASCIKYTKMPKEVKPANHAKLYRTEPYPTAAPSASSVPARQSSISQACPSHERPSTAWTQEDDARLMQFRAQGLNWQPIAEHFQGKTSNACRKRHERLMEKKNNEAWDSLRIEELASAYLECREKMWRIMAEHLGEHAKWQTIETKCMEKGLKNLFTAARNRKGSRQHFSPPVSHHSDEHFDDSGLGPDLENRHHSLPPPGQAQVSSQPTPSSLHHASADSGNKSHHFIPSQLIGHTLSHSRSHSSLGPSHPSLLSNSMPYATFSSPPAPFPAPLASYSMPPPTTSSLSSLSALSSSSLHPQTLPSFSRGFEINLPPMTSLMPRHGGQVIGASYA